MGFRTAMARSLVLCKRTLTRVSAVPGLEIRPPLLSSCPALRHSPKNTPRAAHHISVAQSTPNESLIICGRATTTAFHPWNPASPSRPRPRLPTLPSESASLSGQDHPSHIPESEPWQPASRVGPKRSNATMPGHSAVRVWAPRLPHVPMMMGITTSPRKQPRST